MLTVLRVITLFTCKMCVFSAIFHLDAEDYVDRYAIHRSKASGEKTVNFNKGQSLNLYFCLRTETPVALHNVRFSNDGGSDTFEVSIDGIRLGKITTSSHSDSGANWNKFLLSDQLGPTMNLPSGRHKVTLNFTDADVYGVEIDQVQIRAEDTKLKEDLFNCALYCVANIHYNNGPARDDMASAVAQRKILQNTCPTDDNIVVPIYHEDLQYYLISAFMPKYRTFENNNAINDESCSVVKEKSILWSFDDIAIPVYNGNKISTGAEIKYYGSNTTRSMKFVIVFDTLNNENEFDKGTLLRITFKEPYGQIYMQITYKNKFSEWSEPRGLYINYQQMEATLTIPPHTWLNAEKNEIEILILSRPDVQQIVFDRIELTRRRIEREDEYNVYESKDIQMNSVNINTGDTIKDNEKMAIRRMDERADIKESSYLSIFHYTPWSRKSSEVFRLHQDGRLQLLPMTPHGLNKIPFGTTVVVGQSDPKSDSPKAPIDYIDVDPAALQLYIHYRDNSTASLLVKPSLQETRVIVKDVVMTKDQLEFPFAAVTTMWQYDGNSEADHVSSNGNVEHHIVNGWDTLYGTSFTFFRKCISRHNTQSPDIQIQLIDEKDLYLHV